MKNVNKMTDEQLLSYIMGDDDIDKTTRDQMVEEWNNRREKDGGFDATEMILGQ